MAKVIAAAVGGIVAGVAGVIAWSMILVKREPK
jgi:hypothetical protein